MLETTVADATSRAYALARPSGRAGPYAISFSWFRSATTPIRLLQSVASGLLGREGYSGGIATAALGLALHFTIALTAAEAGHALFTRDADFRRIMAVIPIELEHL